MEQRRMERRKEPVTDWKPRTKLGRMVREGKITSMSEAINSGLPLREPEIVDILLPNLEDEVLSVNMVQRMTDSGRRIKFAITTVVGNGDGYVGLGHVKGKEVGQAIRRSIDDAKLNLIEIKRGCGSWQCGCMKPHTLPYKVLGKCGSVEITFIPAPRGVGLAVGNVAKHVLRLAGVKDAWSLTDGKTRTTVNMARAAFNALQGTARQKVRDEQATRLRILSGASGIAEGALVPDPTKADLSVAVDKEAMVPTPEDAATVSPPKPEGKPLQVKPPEAPKAEGKAQVKPPEAPKAEGKAPAKPAEAKPAEAKGAPAKTEQKPSPKPEAKPAGGAGK
jgi:small subunit ribosomal protein S5